MSGCQGKGEDVRVRVKDLVRVGARMSGSGSGQGVRVRVRELLSLMQPTTPTLNPSTLNPTP